MTYAYRDRKDRKGRSGGCGPAHQRRGPGHGMTYNRFVQGLRLAGIEVDQRMLAELAVAERGGLLRPG